jgi:hypothetical protein
VKRKERGSIKEEGNDEDVLFSYIISTDMKMISYKTKEVEEERKKGKRYLPGRRM